MSEYHKLSAGLKLQVSRDSQRERAVECPRCSTQVSPSQLIEHQAVRCTGERPTPMSCARWLQRGDALHLMRSSVLDELIRRGVIRTRADGCLLERDLVQVIAWARVLEAL